MTTLNVKTLYIDCDDASLIANVSSTVAGNVSFLRGNEYVLQARTMANATSSVAATFDSGDDWYLYIGRQYESNANPVVIISDPSKFNNTTDWSSANVSTGYISARVNVSGTLLDQDMANNSTENYRIQWVTNNGSGLVMVLDNTCYVNNSVQK